MADTREVRVLNGLLAATRNSPLAHLRDSAVFVSTPAAEEVDALQAMMREEAAHASTLAELLLEMGEVPRPAPPDSHAANLHYLEFQYLIPHLVRAKESLLSTYESARAHLSRSPRALEVVTRLEGRQREHVSTLRRLQSGPRAAAASEIHA